MSDDEEDKSASDSSSTDTEEVADSVGNNATPSKSKSKNPKSRTPNNSTPSKQLSAAKPTSSAPASSPKRSYVQMVHDAIVALKDRTGSSQVAIMKYILANNPDVEEKKMRQRLSLTLKTGISNKRFVKVKSSYKIHPDAKKKKKKAKPKPKPKPQKKPEIKKLTPAQIAAQKEKERQQAKEKERLERIRKRKFPMEDTALIAEDKELGINPKLPSKPSLTPVFPDHVMAWKSDSMTSGLMDDVIHVYHFFRGDLGWGRFGKGKDRVVAPFTLRHLLFCTEQILKGAAKKARMVPPLISHLFVVALQNLVPAKLQVGLNPASWSEILLLYMDAMERFYTTEISQDPSALPGLAIDTDYLLGISDEPEEMQLQDLGETEPRPLYLRGSLAKAHSKLLGLDPWLLNAEEIFCLLVALVDDLLATLPVCQDELDARAAERQELAKKKRAADALTRKLQNAFTKEQAEEKERDSNGEKSTRSNTKLPSISGTQIETSKRAQQRANDAYEKALRTKVIRTGPVGHDRDYNAFYHCHQDPDLVFVLQKGKSLPPPHLDLAVPGLDMYKTSWLNIDKRSVLEKYLDALDIRGQREGGLIDALQPARKYVYDDLKAMNDRKALLKEKRELQRRLENAKLKCEVGRKSGRLAAQSEQEFSTLQSEIDSLEGGLVVEVKKKPDCDNASGLLVLTEFDDPPTQPQKRRTTRRDQSSAREETDSKDTLPRHRCSRLWASGNVDGTGIVGSIVNDMLKLEERMEKLAAWEDVNRKEWVETLKSTVLAWNDAGPLSFEEVAAEGGEQRNSTNEESPSKLNNNKKQRKSSGGSGQGGSSSSTPGVVATSFQAISALKYPLLALELRVFQLSGLAMAAQDTNEADENMSAAPEEDKEQLEKQEWKKLIHRLKGLSAKSHIKIRELVVDAIASARRTQQGLVVSQLRDALLQFHPEAAGACKSAALATLIEHGDYDDTNDEDSVDMDVDEPEEEVVDIPQEPERESGISSVLCFQAVVLSSSLDGHEDATRADWMSAVKKCRTLAKFSALVSAFCSKASKTLEKMTNEKEALEEAIEAWGGEGGEKPGGSGRKKKKQTQNGADTEPSDVWAHVDFSDEFCLAKVEEFPWWPARKCIAKDREVKESLERLGRTLVSLVGELGGLRVVKTEESVRPYSEDSPEHKDLSSISKDIRGQLDDCMAIARRVIRAKQKKRPKKAKPTYNEFKEEKKLAT